MKREEIWSELNMSYDELVTHLLNKYGPAKYDYFRTESCRSRNPKVSRSDEGLTCHHIDEDKAIMLNDPQYAVFNPFEYQKADRLVYCNVLEHLLLHMKIVLEPKHPDANWFERQGMGGFFNICNGINTYYGGYEYKREYEKKKYEIIADNFKHYLAILVYFKLMIATYYPQYKDEVREETLSQDFKGNIVPRVYDELSPRS